MGNVTDILLCDCEYIWIRSSGNMVVKPYQWFAWLSTACLLTAALLAAFNVYPLYVWAFIISNTMWIIVGILWSEKSLIVMNAGLTIIYVAGLLLA